jgi:hypothetical protein
MSNPTEAFTRNSFVEKVMKWIPDDALTQSKFIYYLTIVVFLGLIGYGVTAWYNFFFHSFQLSYLFSGLFMTAIGFISLFGLKQTRNSYFALKEAYSQPVNIINLDNIKDMKKEFDNVKNKNTSSK